MCLRKRKQIKGRKGGRRGADVTLGANGQARNAAAGEAEEAEDEDDAPMFSLGDAPASRIDAVSTSTPVDDFRAMLAQKRDEEAFRGLAKAVDSLVSTSIGDRRGPTSLLLPYRLYAGCSSV